MAIKKIKIEFEETKSFGSDIHFFEMICPPNKVSSNVALLVDKDQAMLFYPSSLFADKTLIKKLAEVVPLPTIQYVVIHHLDGIPFNFFKVLLEYGIKAKIITDEKIATQLRIGIPLKNLIIINKRRYKFHFKSKRAVQFIPAQFLHHAGSFAAYDVSSRTLFSGSVFGTIESSEFATIEDFLKESLILFHQKFIPSSEYLKPFIKHLSKKEIQRILPEHGHVLEGETMDVAIQTLSDLDFYNTNLMVTKVIKSRREYNYPSLCDQIIRRFKALYGSDEVLRVFEGSEIRIDPVFFEIDATMMKGYQLWHRLFEVAYDKKGTSWLAVVEPIVNKLTRLYHIKKPVIYKSVLASSRKKIDRLDEENIQLKEKLDSMQAALQETSERLIRNPVTGVYNEKFFINYLREEIRKDVQNETGKDIVLLFIDIDNIRSINLKYSKEAGDETLRHLAYLLNQIKTDNEILFKRNGPGFIFCLPGGDYLKGVLKAEEIRNYVSDSEVFIEPVTVSIGVVRLYEFDEYERTKDDIIDKFYFRGEGRLRIASTKGKNLIIDEKSQNIKLSIGKILIIDAEEIIHSIFKSAFTAENFEVLIAKDGLVALEMIHKHNIDCIISERNVAKLDGLGIKSRLNQSTETQMIPFFIMTYNKNREFIIRANQLNVDMVFSKPIIMEEMLVQVKRILFSRSKP